jgi:hypothetical protein
MTKSFSLGPMVLHRGLNRTLGNLFQNRNHPRTKPLRLYSSPLSEFSIPGLIEIQSSQQIIHSGVVTILGIGSRTPKLERLRASIAARFAHMTGLSANTLMISLMEDPI